MPHPDADPATPTAEHRRLADSVDRRADWKNWGPYVSDRAWGTVREDYSPQGDAWSFFPHDHARSRAYRWNEDGLAGFCNRFQNLCLAVALWNGRDPILKERPFGLAGPEGNHGEDVKEYYFHLDGTPTHSYMRMLYKYPQVEYPYEELLAEARRRTRADPENELIDAIGDSLRAGRYFDVSIEYAKADQEDILCRITAVNRGPEPAPLHILPHVWARNTWSWGYNPARPELAAEGESAIAIHGRHRGQDVLVRRTRSRTRRNSCSRRMRRTIATAVSGSPRPCGRCTPGAAFHDYVIGGDTPGRVNPRPASAPRPRRTYSGGRSSRAGRSTVRRPPVGETGSWPNPFTDDFDSVFRLRRQSRGRRLLCGHPPAGA